MKGGKRGCARTRIAEEGREPLLHIRLSDVRVHLPTAGLDPQQADDELGDVAGQRGLRGGVHRREDRGAVPRRRRLLRLGRVVRVRARRRVGRHLMAPSVTRRCLAAGWPGCCQRLLHHELRPSYQHDELRLCPGPVASATGAPANHAKPVLRAPSQLIAELESFFSQARVFVDWLCCYNSPTLMNELKFIDRDCKRRTLAKMTWRGPVDAYVAVC